MKKHLFIVNPVAGGKKNKYENSNTSYVFISQLLKYDLEFQTKLLGSFNIENLLASFSLFKLLTGLDLSFVYFIDRLKMVKGRMNLYKLNNFNICNSIFEFT